MTILKEAETVAAIAGHIFGADLVAVYLYGSGVSGGLRPLSDIDLIVVTGRPMRISERESLTTSLLKTSGRYPNLPGDPRCLEVSVVVKGELAAPSYPAKSEFLYGEWLRAELEGGLIPKALSDPGVTLMLAQARREAVPVIGPYLSELLAEIPAEDIRRAMREAIPSLVDGLRGDERNVLLTLARMWRTAATGEFVSKDAAVDWVAPLVPSEIGNTLKLAREAYLGIVADDWSDRADEATRASAYLQQKV